jgi:hypothetical protein
MRLIVSCAQTRAGFITEHSVIKRILDHLRKRDKGRPPPLLQPAVTRIA